MRGYIIGCDTGSEDSSSAAVVYKVDKEVLWIDLAKIPEGVSLEKFNEDFDKLGVWSQVAVDSLLESYNTKEIENGKILHTGIK